MAISRSGPKYLENCKTVFGDELGSIYYRLSSAWTYANRKTSEYCILFSNRENLDLINAVGGRFFASIQYVLFYDILLQLTLITDNEKTVGNKNLTIQMLPRFFDDCEEKKIVRELVDEAVKATDFARNWRNKRITHFDYDHHMDPELNPLKPASLVSVQNALVTINHVLNKVDFIKTGGGRADFIAPYRPIAKQLIANLEIMRGYLLRAESSGEVPHNSDGGRLVGKFKELQQEGNPLTPRH